MKETLKMALTITLAMAWFGFLMCFVFPVMCMLALKTFEWVLP